MIICVCNAFNDTAVKEYLESIPGVKTTVRTVYNACTGGEEPNCGKCIRNNLNPMVKEHNDGITPPAVQALP